MTSAHFIFPIRTAVCVSHFHTYIICLCSVPHADGFRRCIGAWPSIPTAAAALFSRLKKEEKRLFSDAGLVVSEAPPPALCGRRSAATLRPPAAERVTGGISVIKGSARAIPASNPASWVSVITTPFVCFFWGDGHVSMAAIEGYVSTLFIVIYLFPPHRFGSFVYSTGSKINMQAA